MRNRPLNFIAGNRGISLGTPVARNPCTSSGDSRVSSACSSAGVDVTLRCPSYDTHHDSDVDAVDAVQVHWPRYRTISQVPPVTERCDA